MAALESDSPQLGRVPEFDSLREREQRWAVRGADRFLVRFNQQRPAMTDDNRRRAIKMGLYACAVKWMSIWVACALPASILWGALLGEQLYWLLFLPGLLTVVGLSALTLSLQRYRMMRRYYPERFAIDTPFRPQAGGGT